MSDDLVSVARSAGISEDLVQATAVADFPAEAAGIALGMSMVFNGGDPAAAREYVADEFVDHEAPPGSPGGPEGYAATAAYMRSVFSAAKWEAHDFFAAGDRFAVRLTFSGRHTGEFLGIPATGKTISVQHLHIYRIANGKAVEHWGGRDDLSLLIQLGVIPPSAATAPVTAGAYAPRTDTLGTTGPAPGERA